MKILAVDSSGLVASVAVVEEDILLAEYTMNYKKTYTPKIGYTKLSPYRITEEQLAKYADDMKRKGETNEFVRNQ